MRRVESGLRPEVVRNSPSRKPASSQASTCTSATPCVRAKPWRHWIARRWPRPSRKHRPMRASRVPATAAARFPHPTSRVRVRNSPSHAKNSRPCSAGGRRHSVAGSRRNPSRGRPPSKLRPIARRSPATNRCSPAACSLEKTSKRHAANSIPISPICVRPIRRLQPREPIFRLPSTRLAPMWRRPRTISRRLERRAGSSAARRARHGPDSRRHESRTAMGYSRRRATGSCFRFPNTPANRSTRRSPSWMSGRRSAAV